MNASNADASIGSTGAMDGSGVAVPPPDLAAAIRSARANRARLMALPHVVAVRGGYKFVDGRITDTAAVVVAVDRKPSDVRPADRIPPVLPDGMPTDVTIADPIERLSAAGELEGIPARVLRPQLLIQQLQPAEEDGELEGVELEAVPPITYTPPSDANLDPVTGPMTITCHVSPDAGWSVLHDFLEGTSEDLTLGMYDFTAPHIFDAARTVLAGPAVTWRQTLGPGESLPKEGDTEATKADDKPEAVVIAGLRAVAGGRFDSAFAHIGKGQTFASAYHIKVAVRDDKAFWLSSGNWQSSNQPNIDFLAPDADLAVMRDYNREWHVVVENGGLADTFRRFLRHDFETAASQPELPALPEAALPDLLVPVEAVLEAALPLEAFPPRRFTFKTADPLTVQPILTPDNYVGIVLELLRKAPKKRLYFQNQSLNPVKTPTPEWAELLHLLATYSRNPDLDVRIIFRNIGDVRKKEESQKAAGFNMDRIRVQKGCHTKGIIIDGETLLVGSHNWTDEGVQANRDASLLIRDKGIAGYYEKVFLHDWERLARRAIVEAAMPIPVIGGNEGVAPADDTRTFRVVPWSAWEEE